jgi:hypothetical protein
LQLNGKIYKSKNGTTVSPDSRFWSNNKDTGKIIFGEVFFFFSCIYVTTAFAYEEDQYKSKTLSMANVKWFTTTEENKFGYYILAGTANHDVIHVATIKGKVTSLFTNNSLKVIPIFT